MLKLDQYQILALLRQPESGMGYQTVQVVPIEGVERPAVVYNADLLVFESEPRPAMEERSYGRLLMAARSSSQASIASLRVVDRRFRASAVHERFAKSESGEAKDAPVEKTTAGEVFKRFSAYQNDRRVNADGSLSAGTFATTEKDATNVKTGMDAVRRYALPTSEPASWRLTSKPDAGTAIQRGIAAHANGHPGGGVEVFFAEGTQAHTTTGPDKIPDGV